MPQYDESFISDDSANQRRNKRSYRVYKKGCLPSSTANTNSPVSQQGTYILKNNINNLRKSRDFGSNFALKEKPNNGQTLYPKSINKSFPSLLEKDALFFNDDKYIFSPNSRDIFSKNNNFFSFHPGKSLENLSRTNQYAPIKSVNCLTNGKSLQNVSENVVKNNNIINKYHSKNSLGYLARVRSKEAVHNGFSSPAINGDTANNGGKMYENNTKYKEKAALRLAARILESGVYRQLGKSKQEDNEDSGFAEDFNGGDSESTVATPPSSGGGSGHKASFRSANKLARRARSFKEDLLERISAMAMRSPGQQPSNRSHSPLSPKTRGQPKLDDPEVDPSKDLEVLVRQVRFGLKHFCDVISKNKLEMLPGNGTIILETITNMHTVIRPHVSPLGVCPSAALSSALGRLCQAVARLIRLCDEGMMGGEGCAALDSANVEQITQEVHGAVEELASIAFEKMGVNTSQMKSNSASSDPKYLKLQVRPAIGATPDGQRNSLPDIPLTPRERSILEGTVGGLNVVRSSHSTESILDSVASTLHHTEPPPKPPRPIRVSLQSHSSGSLDSMLNTSNDEEIRAIMDRSSTHLDDEIIGSFHCPSSEGYTHTTNGSNRLSIESNSTLGSSPANTNTTPTCVMSNTSFLAQQQNRLSGGDASGLGSIGQGSPAHNRLSGETTLHGNSTNHNRFSNESGFVSMGTRCSDFSYSSFNSVTTQQQKTSLSFIDATPTPQDVPPSITDFITADDRIVANISSPPSKILGLSMANVVQQSMKQVSSSNYFEQNTQSKKSFSQAASEMKDAEHRLESLKIESSSFTKRNISQTVVTNVKSNLSNISNISESSDGSSDFSSLLPPALPIKTRKLKAQCDCLNDSAMSSLNTTMDDQTIEYRNHNACTLHSLDNFIQRPHTLMDHTSTGNQPPPLPLKKKHIMAYMEMFGNCSHPPQNNVDFIRHSVHAYNSVQHPGGHFMHSSQLQQLASSAQVSSGQDNLSLASFQQNGQSTLMSVDQNGYVVSAFSTASKDQTIMNFSTQNAQALKGVVQNGQIMFGGSSAGLNQMTQSQTVHQFNIASGVTNQINSSTSSPMRSPRLLPDEAMSPPPPLPPLPPPHSSTPPSISPRDSQLHQTPPALPPKKGKAIKSLVSKTNSVSGVSSPNTPSSICGTPTPTPSSVRGASTSPQPKFQFDVQPPQPSHDVMDDALLLNVDDERWQKQQEQSIPSKPGKFPVEDLDLDDVPPSNPPPPPPPQPPSPNPRTSDIPENEGELDLIMEMDVSSYLVKKASSEEGPEIRGGHPDALIVHAIKSTKDFSYQEAFLTTYRTFVTPVTLIGKLNRRHSFLSRHGKHTKAREVQALLTRVVGDLTIADLDDEMLQLIMDFVYGLVCSGDLAMAKALRVIILEKYKNKINMQQQQSYPAALGMSARRDSVLEQKSEAVAEQMTLLDAELFTRIPPPEALLWARDQCEETSPNLTRFTEHFNKMSYWARSKILEQEDAKDREKYITKFIKVMKHLRKMNNFNSYLALLSALDSAPIRRLEWQKHITDILKEYCALIDSSSSFSAYRKALAEAQPPCIPYIGLVLQDLTFVHIGNSDLLDGGNINFSKRWQQYHILENMKRFNKAQYTFKKNERIISMFNGFNDFINEEAMWQISESIKPRGGKKTAAT